MSSRESELETDIDYEDLDRIDYLIREENYEEKIVEDPQSTGSTSEVDNPYIIINKLIEKNWYLERKLRDLERDYKEEYKNLVRENNENIRNYTNQINSLENKINTLIKSKERRFGISDSLLEEKIRDYLIQEKEESNI
ncbi:MAG: hypothetical protein ACFFCV_07190 [Promethearchaeota archaeon]